MDLVTCCVVVYSRDAIGIYTKLYDTIRYLYIYGIAAEAVRSYTEHVPISLVRHVQLLRIYI
jgi:hypothetical protein